MASEKAKQWTFSKEQLEKSPSRKHGIDEEKELGYRQQTANLIQDMGQRLAVNQLTINTAIVYMHRFYMYHSFMEFSRYAIAPTALFLAAKVEEQPKKLEHVLKICYTCLHPDKPNIDTHSDSYLKQVQELVQNELILLQTLGFDISVDHPHTHVVKCTQLVKASRDLSQMAYFMATNSLHLTTFCLLYKPAVVAAMCIHLSCKWSNYEIPLSSDKKPYWSYMDSSITEPLLDTIVKEFLKILNRCPTRLRKLKNYRPQSGGDKEEQKDADPKSGQSSTQTAQASNQPQTSQSSAPPKEKKPTMSYEEYKRTHKQQPPPQQQLPKPQPHQSHAHSHAKPGQPIPGHPKHHSDNRPPHQREPNKQQGHLPHPHMQNKHLQVKQEPRGDSQKQHHRPNPSAPTQNHVLADGQKQAKDAALQRNMMAPGHRDPNKGKLAGVNVDNAKAKVTADDHADSAEVLAVSKDLEGRIRSEKMQNHRPHQDSSHQRPAGHHPVSNQAAVKQEGPRRHHGDKNTNHEASSNQSRPKKDFKVYDRKTVVEMYKKHPDKLKSYLKHKAQAVQLTDEEKHMYAKLQHDEERRKRKALEKQQQKAKTHAEGAATPTASPGSGLTLRIKLPPNTAQAPAEPVVNTSIAKIIGSSSGSGSEASPVRPRKRGHGNEPAEHTAAKQSRKLEDQKHHRSSGNGSSSGGSSHKHKRHHHHHSKHQSRSSKNAEHIDEAVFQKSLSAAISQVKKSGIPTVTLKKASNGGEYVASSTVEFDPSAPVSAKVPEEIFEEEQDSGAIMATNSQLGSLASRDSTPEPGEIMDTPPSQHFRKGDPQQQYGSAQNARVPSLFSPPSDVESKLQRSGFGYHGNSENDFTAPPPLLRKPAQ